MKVIKVYDKTGIATPATCHGCCGEYPITTNPKEWRLYVLIHDGRRLRTLTYCQRCAWFLRELTKARFAEKDYEQGRMKWRLLPNQLKNKWQEYMDDMREDAVDGYLNDAIPIIHETVNGVFTGRCRPMTPEELAAFREQHPRVMMAEN